ncbi:hypothetical protein [Variovorax arabinosiphilus]|uniref:hypothetical protein n=1 Tax=Variovorax arabinosiphilus TaxID=3053498 RepID=UPI002574A6FC|nr:hypothetical protein [Variovorax sp. J2L1-63]MDM0130877.1 hypothetical protein [Variovorax sp. J2L1-63]
MKEADRKKRTAVLGQDQSRDDPRLSGFLRTSDAWLGRKLRSATREPKFWC